MRLAFPTRITGAVAGPPGSPTGGSGGYVPFDPDGDGAADVVSCEEDADDTAICWRLPGTAFGP